MKNYKNYEYSIEENGYTIYLEGKAFIDQHEPYIPMKDKSYEENAEAQIDELIASQEKKGEPTLEEQITDLQLALAELAEMISGGNQ